MGYQAVNFYVVDNTPSANPVPGAIVRIFTTDTRTPVTQAITDSTGLAALLLPGGFTYEARYFLNRFTFDNPQLFTVVDSPNSNNFNVVGVPFAPPLATNPRLCMAYGFFKDVTGAPAPFVDIQFIAQFDPLLFDGAGMTTERRTVRTDADGYVQIPLVQFGMYSVIVAGFEDLRRTIKVPGQPNINLPDLIWPVVSQITFSPAAPFNITVGTDLITTPSVYASDGELLQGTAPGDVQWSTADQTVAAVLMAANTLTLRGFKPGTTQLIAVRQNMTIVRIPEPGIQGVPATINVS